ncbi:MAG: sigma-70 family RNA polymerase sigma factor [Bryobacteraceae bacterium]
MTPEAAFDQYSQVVYSFLFRLTRREDIAEDLTQETFLSFVRRPERFDPERGSVKTYLLSIARHLALKHYRDQRSEEQLDDEELYTRAIDPRAGLDAGSAVADAVASLSTLQQEALILFEYEGATLEEIAHIVGADVGTVKSRLHRARARIKRMLAAYGTGGKVHGAV